MLIMLLIVLHVQQCSFAYLPLEIEDSEFDLAPLSPIACAHQASSPLASKTDLLFKSLSQLPNTRHVTFMIVDDQELILRSHRAYLTTAVNAMISNGEINLTHFSIRQFTKPDDALSALLTNHDEHILITDNSMPTRGDGIELIRRLQTNNINIPTIMISSDANIQETAESLGAEFITKPANSRKLRRTLSRTQK